MRLGCWTPRFFVFSCHLKSLDWHIWKIYLYCTSWILIYQSISFISFWISDQTCLFLAAAVISCFLGGILAAFLGVALTARRSVGECENGEWIEHVADHVERGGGKGQRRGHSPLPPPPFPLFAQATQGRECIVRMLSTLVYICFVRAGGAGFVWYLNTIEHSDRTLFFKSKDLSLAILLSIVLVSLPGYFIVSQYSCTIENASFFRPNCPKQKKRFYVSAEKMPSYRNS